MNILESGSNLLLITGHYGVGKTNLALNIARDLRAAVSRVTLIDLDVVNPYFRSTDYHELLAACDIRVLGPVHAASSLDTPSLSPGIDEAIADAGENHAVVIDVGCDPDGARALARYADKIAARSYRMFFVANMRRPETQGAEDNLALMRGIEATSGLMVTEIVGNTHLKEFSAAQDIVVAITPTLELARRANLPLAAVALKRSLLEQVTALMAGLEGFELVGLEPAGLAPANFGREQLEPAGLERERAELGLPKSSVLSVAKASNAAKSIHFYPIDILVATSWELSP